MKVTNQQVISLYELLPEIYDKDLKADLSWKIVKLNRVLKKEIEILEEVLIKLAEKYGKKDEKGNLVFFVDSEGNVDKTRVVIKAHCTSKYQEEVDLLLAQEIELNSPSMSLEDFNDIKIKPLLLDRLEPFLMPGYHL